MVYSIKVLFPLQGMLLGVFVHHVHLLIVKLLDLLGHSVFGVHLDLVVLSQRVKLTCQLIVQVNGGRARISNARALVLQSVIQELQLLLGCVLLDFGIGLLQRLFETLALNVKLLENSLQALNGLEVGLQSRQKIVFDLDEHFLNVEDAGLSLGHFLLLADQLLLVFLSIIFLNSDVNPTSYWHKQPLITDLRRFRLLPQLRDI